MGHRNHWRVIETDLQGSPQGEVLTLSTTISIFFELLNVFFLFFESDRAQAGEGQRETETQNRKQAPGSEPSAQTPTWGSNSRTVTS